MFSDIKQFQELRANFTMLGDCPHKDATSGYTGSYTVDVRMPFFLSCACEGKLRSEVGAIRNGVCCMSTGQRVASADRLKMCHMQYKPDASVALVDTATTSQYTTGGQYPGWSGYYLVRAFTAARLSRLPYLLLAWPCILCTQLSFQLAMMG